MWTPALLKLLTPLPDQSDCIHGASNPAANVRQVRQDALEVETSKRLLRAKANGLASLVKLQAGTGRGDLRIGQTVGIHCAGDLLAEAIYSVPFARDSCSGRAWIGAGQYTDFIRRW